MLIQLNMYLKMVSKRNSATRGLYIGKYPPPLGGGKYKPMSFGEKYEKWKRKRGKM
jgi:hypothetical protein